MEDINILVLSAGRRVELINEFRKAAKKLNINSKIITADILDTAPAIYFSDKNYIIPRIDEPLYIESIIDICNKENVKIIIPTIDTELLSLARSRSVIEKNTKAKLLLSDLNVIEICRDKTKTQKFFEDNCFGTPRLITNVDDDENYDYPLFIKPVDGSSSYNTYKINNYEELKFFSNYISNPLVQEYVNGEEYSVDCFLDFDSNVISITPRIRLVVRSGEVIKGKIDKNKEIINEVFRMLEILKPIGQVTIQCIKNESGIKYIEINPRFGGGAPMSIKAGANSCEYIYNLLLGNKLEYSENYQDGLMFLRFDDSVTLNQNMERI